MLTQFTNTLIEFLNRVSSVLPLPWFALGGSFVEEVIAPIPSPLVMTLAGSIAAAQNHAWLYLVFLAVLGAIGKTVASYLLYLLADKVEDIAFSKLGRFIGITHKQVESIGRLLNKGWKDDIFLFLLRAVPIVPSAPISIICGLIKLNVRTYITSTFIGTIVRNMIYLGIGYTGVNATESIILKMENLEVVGYGVIFLIFGAAVGYAFYQRYKDVLYHKLFHGKDDGMDVKE